VLLLYRAHPAATLFPYTTLFRSRGPRGRHTRGHHPVRIDTRPAARYVVNPSTLDNRLRAAYAVAGLPVPSVLAHVEDALRTEPRSEEHTSELQSRFDLVCRLLLE